MMRKCEMRGRTGKEINPRVDRHALRLLALHHAECLVKDGLARLTVVDNFNQTLGKGESTTIGVLVDSDAPSEGEFDENAAAQRVGDVVVPK